MDGSQENDKGFVTPDSAGGVVSFQGQTPVQGAGPFLPAGGQAGGSPPAARRPIPPKFYRIGEVATYAGTSRQTIHNYTTMGLIQESQWSQGGHRLYDETVFSRLDEILLMKAHRRTLKDIRESLEGRPDRRT
jgi:hypothetical protein